MTPDKGYGEYQVPTAPEGKALTKFFDKNMTIFKISYQFNFLIVLEA